MSDYEAEVYRNWHYVPYFGQPLADASACVFCITTTPWSHATVEDIVEPFGLLPAVQSPILRAIARPNEAVEKALTGVQILRNFQQNGARGDRETIEQVTKVEHWIDEHAPIVKEVYNRVEQVKATSGTVRRYLPMLPEW